MKYIPGIIGIIILFTLCGTKEMQVHETLYNLKEPSETILLQEKLMEISGIDFYNDRLFAVHDEKSFLFELDRLSGKVIHQIDLGKVRDYEGLAVRDSLVIITTSDGKILSVDLETEEVNQVTDQLLEGYDVEGLAFNKENNAFLLACKAYGEDQTDYQGNRLILEFQPDSYLFSDQPYLLLEKKRLNEFVAVKYKSNKTRTFKPSGLAFHPTTGDLYVLSSKSRAIVVYGDSSKLKDVMLFNQDVIQPEGIAFDDDLTLYIASEGGGFGPPKLFKFTPLQP